MDKEIIEMAKQAGFSEAWLTADANVPYGEAPRVIIKNFAKLIAAAKAKEIADKCEKLPFGDTAHSFAVWIREQ